ncbi:MAG: Gfo/Idh/MocA family oxidoreductase [Candidatus Paceibacterota bacterium]
MINVAIVGLGKQGNVHLEALLKLREEDKVNLVAVCDQDKDFIQNLSKEVNTEGFSDYHEMLSKYGDNLDLLILALPNDAYSDIIFSSRNKKYTILKEKPFAISADETIAYRYLERKNNLKIYTAQQRFFTNAYIQAKKWIDEGIIGDPLFFEYQYGLNDQKESWYWNVNAGGGCWLNTGWHMIFVIVWFFGKPEGVNVSKIKTRKRSWEYDTDDTAMFSCRYDKGLVGKGFVSVTDVAKEKRIKIAGSKGYIVIIKNKAVLYNNNDEIMKEIEDELDVEIYKRQIMDFMSGGEHILELEKYNALTTDIINSY